MFPSKLLLFGEYSLLRGSKALSVPFAQFSGEWSSFYEFSTTLNLSAFAGYLESKYLSFPFTVDTVRFRREILSGLQFKSSIPIGYGVGSSGALCAAFYSRFVTNPVSPHDTSRLSELKQHLALLEGFFHGTSSGIDPLVSYLQCPVLVEHNGSMKILDKKIVSFQGIRIFLIDTGAHGHTKVNVELFEDMLKTDYYPEALKNQYNPLVDKCISAFLKKDTRDFFALALKLTQSQQVYFEPMIRAQFLKYFRRATDTGDFALKLCGSGGGGFILGFTTDMENVKDYFLSEGIDLIIPDFDRALIPEKIKESPHF